MKRMAMLETSADVDKVHASADYINLISSHASGRALLAGWEVASVCRLEVCVCVCVCVYTCMCL